MAGASPGRRQPGRRTASPRGVLSLLALHGWPGAAATLALVQALGDAGVDARLWVLTSGAVATGAGGHDHGSGAGRGVGPGPGGGAGAPAAVGRPDRPAAGRKSTRCQLAARVRAVLAGAQAAARTRSRCGRTGCWPGGWCGRSRPGAVAAVAAVRGGAGHRRDRGARAARGPVAGRAGRRARGAGSAAAAWPRRRRPGWPRRCASWARE